MRCTIHDLEYETRTSDGEYCCPSCKDGLLEILGIKQPSYIRTSNTLSNNGKVES